MPYLWGVSGILLIGGKIVNNSLIVHEHNTTWLD